MKWWGLSEYYQSEGWGAVGVVTNELRGIVPSDVNSKKGESWAHDTELILDTIVQRLHVCGSRAFPEACGSKTTSWKGPRTLHGNAT